MWNKIKFHHSYYGAILFSLIKQWSVLHSQAPVTCVSTRHFEMSYGVSKRRDGSAESQPGGGAEEKMQKCQAGLTWNKHDTCANELLKRISIQ